MSYPMSHKYVDDDSYKFIILSNVSVWKNCNFFLFFPNVMLENGTGDGIFTVFLRNPWYWLYLNLKVATDS